MHIYEHVLNIISQNSDRIKHINREIHSHPETGGKEIFAANLLTGQLAELGFKITFPAAGMETAFIAEYGDRNGPTIAYLAEYDALPEIGHACGHSMIAAAAVGAAIGIKHAIDEGLSGRLLVLGTPAEETDGGKIEMLSAGIFNTIDAALMFHPGDRTMTRFESLALDAIQFDYSGHPAHAAGSPYEGKNALDALILLFSSIGLLRQQLRDDIRIHGIITQGGTAPNVIPDKTQGRFYCRAKTRKSLDEVVGKVRECARGAALMTGTKVEMIKFENSNENMLNSNLISDLFEDSLHELGLGGGISTSDAPTGSSDIGNVSHSIPAIQPYIAVCPEGVASHTREFAKYCVSDYAQTRLVLAAKALAITGFRLLNEPELLRRAKAELKQKL